METNKVEKVITTPEEGDRSKQGNLSFSHIIDCLPTNSVMAVL